MKYKSKQDFLKTVVDRYKDQEEFHQAVEEVVNSIVFLNIELMEKKISIFLIKIIFQ